MSKKDFYHELILVTMNKKSTVGKIYFFKVMSSHNLFCLTKMVSSYMYCRTYMYMYVREKNYLQPWIHVVKTHFDLSFGPS